MADDLSWQLTDRERRKAFFAAAAALSTVLGPFGPLAVWGLEYLYDRRDLIFNSAGAPVRAYTADRSALNLTALSSAIVQPRLAQSTLSIGTSLTDSARKVGLRNGDPVSVTVTGHRYLQSRSGLVVPTRIGERVNVTVPSGGYSVAAFGSRREKLFSVHDPYGTVAGDNITAYGRRQLALPLTARPALASTPAPVAGPAWQKGGALAARTCLWCGLTLASNPLNHALTCTRRPGRTTAVLSSPQTSSKILPLANRQPPRQTSLLPPRQTSFQCDRCYQRFATRAGLDEHMRHMHPFITWVRSWLDEW